MVARHLNSAATQIHGAVAVNSAAIAASQVASHRDTAGFTSSQAHIAIAVNGTAITHRGRIVSNHNVGSRYDIHTGGTVQSAAALLRRVTADFHVTFLTGEVNAPPVAPDGTAGACAIGSSVIRNGNAGGGDGDIPTARPDGTGSRGLHRGGVAGDGDIPRSLNAHRTGSTQSTGAVVILRHSIGGGIIAQGHIVDIGDSDIPILSTHCAVGCGIPVNRQVLCARTGNGNRVVGIEAALELGEIHGCAFRILRQAHFDAAGRCNAAGILCQGLGIQRGHAIFIRTQHDGAAVVSGIQQGATGRDINGVVESIATQVNFCTFCQDDGAVVTAGSIIGKAEGARAAQGDVHLIVLAVQHSAIHRDSLAADAALTVQVHGSIGSHKEAIASRGDTGAIAELHRAGVDVDASAAIQMKRTVEHQSTRAILVNRKASTDILAEREGGALACLQHQHTTGTVMGQNPAIRGGIPGE